jgi:CRP-like cAMP-binding protein
MTVTTVLSVPKQLMIRLLHDQHALSDRFITYMLARNIRIEADLVDQLFNPSEKRLGRTLLLLARYGKPDQTHRVLPRISRETRGNDRDDAIALNVFHEQVHEARFHRTQRRPQGQSFPLDHHRARLTCVRSIRRS